MNTTRKNTLIIFSLLIASVAIYYGLYYSLKQHFISTQNNFRNNEFGDFVGGILNPLFTLISTISIIYLTYIISKSEDRKADEVIETQKRITLNQMRQSALENLIQKTNLYIYEFDKLSIHEAKNKFHRNVLKRIIEEEEGIKESVIVWLIILNELENFKQLKYLFSKLYEEKAFIIGYDRLIDITSKLHEQQTEMKFVESKTISEYINAQEEFLTIIGTYIYSEF